MPRPFTNLHALFDRRRDVVEADGALHEGQHRVRLHRPQVHVRVHHLGGRGWGRRLNREERGVNFGEFSLNGIGNV